jgi:RNA polymerase sigma factor (sigma-70 family)
LVPDTGVEDLLRELAPQVLGALVRRYGHFDVAEDAVQEALLAAVRRWPADGIPCDACSWLIKIASRRMIDLLRSDQARREREVVAARQTPVDPTAGPGDQDDSLLLLFLCCHPALTAPAQAALTLRAVGGLTTAEIAHAFLVSEPTMAQRISRAKQRITASGVSFRMPSESEWPDRLDVVLQVLYLIFNEGYLGTSGPRVHRVELSAEAIRLVRMLHRRLPEQDEVTGLLALMLLTDARRAARTGPHGSIVPMAEQDRSRWDRALIDEGVTLVTAAMSRGTPGPYQMQAAVAAVHDEAARAEDTDWPQILALYSMLERMTGNPVVTLNRAVAAAMVHGPHVGLALLKPLDSDERLARHHRLDAVRAHLLEMAGEHERALVHYRSAARRTTSIAEQRYLNLQVGRLARDRA